MARTRSQRQVYADLLDRYGKEIADAFLSAIDDITSAAELRRLTAAIEAGQIEEALEALHIDPAAYNDMLDAIQRSYTETGRIATDTLPKRGPDGTVLTFRFDGRNPAAERWLKDHSSDLITRITTDQRNAVREALRAGMQRGANPRSTALDIVGRVNRATGRRSGGVIGLTRQQAEYTFTARSELLSGDPKEMANYLTRARRDKRFDRTVKAAIRDGTKVPADVARKATTAYRNRLLQLRGETIGRYEAMTALQKGKNDAIEQAIDTGKIKEANVSKRWRSAGDNDVRHTHASLNGTKAKFREAFVTSSGARLMHPMDTSQGAGLAETAGCRCDTEHVVDWLAGVR